MLQNIADWVQSHLFAKGVQYEHEIVNTLNIQHVIISFATKMLLTICQCSYDGGNCLRVPFQ